MKEFKGKKKGIKKAGTTVISATLLSAGAVGIAFAYQSGAAFHPSGKKQDLKKNQIVFSKNKKVTGQNTQKEKDNSRFLKKDQNNDQGAQAHNNADFMFQNAMMMSQQQQVKVADNSSAQQTNQTSGDAGKNNYYQVTKDPANADITVNDPNADNGDNPSSDQNNSSNSNNNNSNSNNDSDNNSNNNSSSDSKDDQDSTTTKRPSDTAKDPDSTKTNPTDGIFTTRPFEEDPTPYFDDEEDGDNASVVIQQSENNPNAVLYKGQSVTKKSLYNSLDTYVRGKDFYAYAFGDNEYDKYIRIDAVSFDGGKTWEKGFPAEIPSDISSGQMKIKVSYRLSQKKSDWVTRVVNYEPKDSRIFLLSQKIEEENTVISNDIILNQYAQNPELGTKMNLLRAQSEFLGSDNLTALFPGWTENGKLLPWFYEVTSGRHILEPSDMVPLDNKYIVKVLPYWMTEDYNIDLDKGKLCYLQTLTDMNEAIAISWGDDEWTGKNLYQKIQVPKYVQAVAIDQDADLSVNELEIPDTVLYIKMDDTGMRVNDKYIVDKENPMYMSTQTGMLMTKDQTEIVGIPYYMKKIKIDETVNKVRIEQKNCLSEIDLSAKKMEQIPEIEYAKLNNCKIIVKDDVLIQYIRNNYKSIFANKGNIIAAASNPDETYTVEKGMILNKRGRVIMLLNADQSTLNLTDQITSIAPDTFNDAPNVQTLVMPVSGNNIIFEENSLQGSKIKTIRCYTREQYDSVSKQLKGANAPEDLVVQLMETSSEGYRYCMQTTDEGQEVILISVPKNIKEFNGIMTDLDKTEIPITEIGSDAFAQCDSLRWVILPESIKKIGTGAFENCTNLEGVLIESKDEITIGDESFDGCDSLRFIGSNAKKGIMENDYKPIVTDAHSNDVEKHRYFYVPGDCEGYNDACISLSSGSDTTLNHYSMEDIGDGARMLYGIDDEGNAWLALRAGKILSDNVTLPKETKEIFDYAMADTISESGEYHLDLDKLDLWAIDEGAFYNSQLGGDVTLSESITMFNKAMAYCEKLKSITISGNGIYLGDEVFVHCSSLESVLIGKVLSFASIQSGMFTGCNNLRNLTLNSDQAESLALAGYQGYQFNYAWTQDEEAKNLRIHIPQGAEKAYIKGWRYIFAGYVASGGNSAYFNMRNSIQFDNINWDTWEFPTDDEIDVLQKQELLVSENRIRKMLGLSQVSEPTELYLYHESGGMVTLSDVPSNTTDLNLGTADMELPEGWYLDYIGTEAFKNAKNLSSLTIPDNMSGIEDNAFSGVESEELTLHFDSEKPLELVRPNINDPFRSHVFNFGVNDENLRIQVPKGSETAYLKAWIFPMLGYEDLDDIQADVMMELWGDDMPSDEEINETVAKRLLPVENRLRKMMGMEEINSIYELCCKDELELTDSAQTQKIDEQNIQVETDTKDEQSEQKQEQIKAQEEVTKDQQTSEDPSDNTEEDTQKDNKEQKQITIPDTTTQLETDTYSKEESDNIELYFEGKNPLKLHIKEGETFSFGKDDDKVKIHVPEGCEEAYIEQWKYAMAGYEDLESMKKAIKKDSGEQITEDEVEEIVSQKLLLGENRLRKMMGMEERKK